MGEVNLSRVPAALRERRQWVLWKAGERDGKLTKLPYQSGGAMAKSNDPATWADFDEVVSALEGAAGIGFVFSEADPFVGIDLDGCRDTESGEVAEWAREIILRFASYAEVSPSRSGIKVFCRGKLPFANGKKVEVDAPSMCDKTPAVEVYDRLRYFAVTGWKVKGPGEPEEAQAAIDWLAAKYFPAASPPSAPLFRSGAAVIDRARKYVARMPPAISGQSGHNATFRVACVLVLGFELGETDALDVLREYNQTCSPPWSEKELLHKVAQAAKQPGPRGYLRNTSPERWDRISVPQYGEPAPVENEPRITTVAEAARAYVELLANGLAPLIDTGIPDLDYALGGGVEKGEMVILAARPSHGKSAVGLQLVHHWTAKGMPCAFISEEMSSLALGKRTVQFVSDIPQEHWVALSGALLDTIEDYASTHAKTLILEGCGTAEVAEKAIRRAVEEHGVQCVVVDYAQLLGAPGKDRYQQMTSMSIKLRQLTSSLKIVLVALCQMSRAIESRNEWLPTMSDIKETGQLEQDADVIAFLCWPHRLDQAQPEGKYQFFIGKNRNREIKQAIVTCRFLPHRQKVQDAAPDGPPQRGYQHQPMGPMFGSNAEALS
jgi:hypothetical protein